MLCEVNDLAGQHEVIAENLQSDVIREINYLVKDIKEERKKVHLLYNLQNFFRIIIHSRIQTRAQELSVIEGHIFFIDIMLK